MRFHLNNHVKVAIGDGRTLSASLRSGKFVKTGNKTDSKKEVDWVCGGRMQLPPFSLGAIPEAFSIRMKTKSRLIVNQAGGILENAGMALHRNFGCPYIPGSAVKGIARHAAWCEWDQSDEDEREINARFLAEIFGFPTGEEKVDKYLRDDCKVEDHSGKVAFLPAYPVSKKNLKLETEILNSHEGGNPVPVFFPAVKVGVLFDFVVRPLALASVLDPEELADWAIRFLKDGLRHYGVGAKTAAGYGWFEEVE